MLNPLLDVEPLLLNVVSDTSTALWLAEMLKLILSPIVTCKVSGLNVNPELVIVCVKPVVTVKNDRDIIKKVCFINVFSFFIFIFSLMCKYTKSIFCKLMI